jgi:glycosyltransferase involved in cell wall biosynthesis
VDVIFWGYDEDDFKNIQKDNHSDFVISHAGLLGYDRNPQTLFEVLKNLKLKDENFAKKLKIKLAGSIDYSVKQAIEKAGLTENTVFMGNISRDKAIDLIYNSDILLLPINKAENAKGRLPGKLYEYLRTYNPVLALGPTDSDAANIISKAKTGATFQYNDYDNIEKFVYQIFTKTRDYQPDTEYIKSFSNEILTGKIAKFLNEIS